MKYIHHIILSVVMIATCLSSQAQEKIGHANIELILIYMPETQTMQATLQSFQKQLSKQLESKENYYNQKLQELSEWAKQSGISSQDDPQFINKAKEFKLENLQLDLTKETQNAEEKLVLKRTELMKPITERLEAKIKEVSKAMGYTLILNSTDSGGVSIVLYAPEERNMTKAIMKAMGIQPPEPEN